jgi:late competence protein required for DNA uptake (superfamily II DNA/RNA helicase)
VSFERSDSEPRGVDGVPGQVELRREARRSGVIASGTLACPDCDAPVAPAGAMALTAALWCPLCDRMGRVRDFLSLEPPTRPARVVVRVSGARALT